MEAGCGLGRWVIPLSENGYEVTGIEIEPEAINIIKKNYISNNLNLVVGDIFKVPFNNKYFDVVISLGVLEHFEEEEVLNRALREHIRVLKDDGMFLVTVPFLSFIRLIVHAPYVKLLSVVRYFKNKKEYFSEYRYSKNEFIKVLENNGSKYWI